VKLRIRMDCVSIRPGGIFYVYTKNKENTTLPLSGKMQEIKAEILRNILKYHQI
jgi:translation initiation factor IF-1